MVVFLSFVTTLGGCGGGPGAPGSSGSEDIGVILEATITPTYNSVDTSSVDAFQDICPSGDPEFFADHSATLTVSAKIINRNATFVPGELFIEKYTIEYRPSTDSIGSPPILTDTRFHTITLNTPSSVSIERITEASIEFLDLTRKFQYASDVTSGIYTSRILNNYTAFFTFEGQNEFGEKFIIRVQKDFQIGNFDNC